MNRITARLRRVVSVSWVLAAGLLAAGPLPGEPPEISPTEVTTLLKLFGHVHYQSAAIRPADYRAVVRDYMAELDPERLFFLEEDLRALGEKHGKDAFAELAVQGSLAAGREISDLFRRRVRDRVGWISQQLPSVQAERTDERYSLLQRTHWAETPRAADETWRKRIKCEVIDEILNGAAVSSARRSVANRYEDLLRHVMAHTPSESDERFLSTVCQLFDHQSSYLSARTLAENSRGKETAASGASFDRRGASSLVKSILAGSPAEGVLHPGDCLISFAGKNGTSVSVWGMTTRQLEDRLSEMEGVQLELVVVPFEATDSSRRRRVVLPSLTPHALPSRAHLEMTTCGKNLVAVLTLPSLYGLLDSAPGDKGSTSSQDVASLLSAMAKNNPSGLVLDLRGNGGGYLSEAIEIAGLFVGRRLVARCKDYRGEILENVGRGAAAYAGPMVVIVDKHTASGAEIIAGVLQCYGRAVVVGSESTWGNGTIQQVIELKQVSRALMRANAKTGAAKLTTQKFYLPDGRSPQLQGIKSDIVIPCLTDLRWRGEQDIPRSLPSDELPAPGFNGRPIEAQRLASLRGSSRQRLQSDPELAVILKILAWQQSRNSDDVSLDLETRQKERRADDSFWTTTLPSGNPGRKFDDAVLREAVRVLDDLVKVPMEPTATSQASP